MSWVILLTLVTGSFAQVDFLSKKDIKARMLKVAEWQLRNPNHELTDWTNGAFYAGVFSAYETTADPTLLAAMMEMGERNGWKPGKRFDHADDIAISQTYVDLYRIKKDKRMIQPTIDSIARIGKDKSNEVGKHGIIWWWCDALFMAPPTLTKLAKTVNDKTYLDMNDKFFKETYDLLYDKQEHLFARDAGYLINAKGEGKLESNGKKVFWSRGNGWVAGGLVRVLKELPKNHPTRSFYENIYREMMERVLDLQQPDGLWRSSLLDPGAYPGSSRRW